MLAAYIAAAERRFPDAGERAAFWAPKLGVPAEQVAATIGDYAKFSNLVRAKLMKQGGVGYVAPSPESFPTIDEFHRLILACGALPCATWLDGMSAGEQAIDELLDLLIGKGAAALNIIPDRNWNIPDPDTRHRKIQKLHEIVRIAGERDLPINIGTEMNSPGNPLTDDFSAVPLAPVTAAFFAGAYFIYGHTVMQRSLGLGYQSGWAQEYFPTRKARNQFYESVGRLADPNDPRTDALRRLWGGETTPDRILDTLAP